MVNISDIDTPSMRWLRGLNACGSGKRRIGRQSIPQAYNTKNAYVNDLLWFATQLKTPVTDHQHSYIQACWRCRRYGRWALKHTREALLSVFEQFNVTIPASVL